MHNQDSRELEIRTLRDRLSRMSEASLRVNEILNSIRCCGGGGRSLLLDDAGDPPAALRTRRLRREAGAP